MSTTAYRHDNLTDDVGLAYSANTSPIDPTKCYIDGSNVLTSYHSYLERRPGFPTYTSDSYGANADIVRWFDWQKWDGSFYIIICVVDVSGVTSKVYKQKIGTDATFQLVHTCSTSSEPFDFVVTENYLFFMNGTDKKRYDGTNLRDWGFAGPSSAPTTSNAAAGNVPAAIGHTYVAAFGESGTGYITDISPESAAIATANRQWDVTVTGTANAACDKIHFYRTEDGGAVWRELSNSPIANPGAVSATIRDNDSDDTLQDTQAPLVGVNAEPVVGVGCIFWQGRVWWVKNSSLYSTGYEEVTNGWRPQSAPTDNKRDFGKPLIGLGTAGPYLCVFAANEIWRLSGDSLATFTLEGSIKNYGSRNRATIKSDKQFCYWLDAGNTVNATDAINPIDLSIPIQPDIDSITHASASIAILADGKRRWLVLCDGGAAKLRVYDLAMGRWMPPWPITSIESVGVGSTAAGTNKLFLGRGGKPLAMNYTVYADESVNYSSYVVTSLAPIVYRANPSVRGVLYYVGIERNASALSDVKYLLDEDPSTGTHISIFANEKDPPGRTNGTNLVEKWYWTKLDTSARRASIRLEWAATGSNFKLYAFDPAYRVGPGGKM